MAGVPMDSPLDALVHMRMNQPQPTGPGQQLPGSVLGALGGLAQGPQSPQEPSGQPSAPFTPPEGLGGAQGPLGALESNALGHGNMAMLLEYLPLLQKMFPQLKVADLKNGEAELTGPTQEQFLGAAHAKHFGAKRHHVLNRGRGQRLHVRF